MRRFLTTGETATLLGLSEATLYRAIRSGEFPAIKVRNRYVIPSRVIDQLEEKAMTERRMVDAAEYELKAKE